LDEPIRSIHCTNLFSKYQIDNLQRF